MAKKLKPSDIKVLIIDQNEKRQANTASRLRVQGYNSKSICEGFMALNLLEKGKEKFNLYFIQGDLADMPGVEISTLIRDLYKDKLQSPIVYIMDKGNEDTPLEIANLLRLGINEVKKECSNFNIIIKSIKKLTNT